MSFFSIAAEPAQEDAPMHQFSLPTLRARIMFCVG
jgi:hypothetical protein